MKVVWFDQALADNAQSELLAYQCEGMDLVRVVVQVTSKKGHEDCHW
jgi:hypothetical protein